MSIASEMAEAICTRRRFVLKDMHGYTMLTARPRFRGWTVCNEGIRDTIPVIGICRTLRISEGTGDSAVLHFDYYGFTREHPVPYTWKLEVMA